MALFSFMDKQTVIAALIYIAGFLLSRKMIQIEHDSEKEELTKGDEILMNALSLLSVFMVIVMLVRAWINQIKKTGYWKKPAKDK